MVGRIWLLTVLASFIDTSYAMAQSSPLPRLGQPPTFGGLSATEVVINGTPATQKDPFAEFTVRILTYNSEGQHVGVCTGTIVARDLILTAGHCFNLPGMGADVYFGTGENNEFTHFLPVLDYRGTRSIAQKLKSPKAVEDPWLGFDQGQKRAFTRKIRSRQKMFNYVDQKVPLANDFLDFTVLKIESIPDGYRPVRFTQRAPGFREDVYTVGFGTNHRRHSKNTFSLRWARQQIIGHYTERGLPTKGWQFYSASAAACLGDSGGPVLIERDGDYQLFAMFVFTYNSCANAGWGMSPFAFKDLIEAAAQELKAEFRI